MTCCTHAQSGAIRGWRPLPRGGAELSHLRGVSFEEGVALDLAYIDRRSFGFDLRLIVRTMWQIVTGRQF